MLKKILAGKSTLEEAKVLFLLQDMDHGVIPILKKHKIVRLFIVKSRSLSSSGYSLIAHLDPGRKERILLDRGSVYNDRFDKEIMDKFLYEFLAHVPDKETVQIDFLKVENSTDLAVQIYEKTLHHKKPHTSG